MGKFKESRTARNLLISFSAEAQARTRYNFFARRAEEDGYIRVARIFDETAEQEYEHALKFFKFFNGGELEVAYHFPAGVIENTPANLLSSAELELHVHKVMYREFADIAVEEGYQRAADTLDAISEAERHHEQLFRELAANIAGGRMFEREQETVWKCLSCGYLHHGLQAPEKCPACVRPQGYFAVLEPLG